MNTRTSRWTTDLLVVLVLTAVASATVLVGPGGSPLRTAAVAPILLFLPGYALVAAIYPERRLRKENRAGDDGVVVPSGVIEEGLPPSVRVGLSVAASIAIVPAVVLALSVATGGIGARQTLLVLAPLTVALTLLAFVRRIRLPDDERMGVPPLTHLLGAAVSPFTVHDRNLSRSATFEATNARGLLLNLFLVAGVLVLVSSVGIAYVYPTEEEGFTELYLVTQSDDGEFDASGYPTEFTTGGDGEPLYVSIGNHEGEEQSYTVVAELQRVEETANGTTVTEEAELTRETRTVAPGETARIEHRPQPPFAGQRLRMQYLLYRGDAPQDPTRENAYRHVQLWVSVDGGGGS
ncbi:DUF1616 domain-containing protein [Halorarum salinum]|uniref:DUF1616 domain-containing protein n=1 Tax=Halorarum salinum TaxID=2743089 RepID=A0A7D5L8E4_9EURY|nr:DUF1616 domain-containing protein [Halobaculum salinum]QLG60390.1 DUF1616 domain-containing protein [Halobaculum salinum]